MESKADFDVGLFTITGESAVGRRATMWQNGRFGPFKKDASIIQFKMKGPKGGGGRKRGMYLLRFRPYGRQKNSFDMWCRRSDFTILEDATNGTKTT